MSTAQEHGSSYEGLTNDDLRASEVSLLTQKGARGPVTDEEYERHYEYIRRVRRSEPSTHKLHCKGGIYSPQRKQAHEELLKEFLELAEPVPRQGKAILVGGMPGAGKSSLVSSLGHQREHYADANPDLIKRALVQRHMEPIIPGLLPLETDELIRYEAGVIDKLLVQALARQRTNLMIDRTFVRSGSITKLVQELKDAGYSTLHGYFVDSDPELAYERTRQRHRQGLDEFLVNGTGFGERPVPGSAIKASRPEPGSPYRSANAQVFSQLVREKLFTGEVRVFDAQGLRELQLENFLNRSSPEI